MKPPSFPARPRVLAAVLLLASSVLGAAPARALSLQDAAELALQNDPRLRAADAQVQSSAAGVDLARAGYLPTASFSGSTGAQRYYLPASLSQAFPLPGVLNPTSGSIRASQPLYNGGLTGAQMASSRGQLEGARADEDATSQRLLLEAATAYLDLERDRVVVDYNQSNLAALQQELSDSNKRFAAGEATRTDVAQATARVAEALAGLKRAMAQGQVGEAAFMRVIGVPPDALASGWPQPPVPANLDQALASAGLTPEVLAAEAQARSARAQIDAARAAWMPKVSLDAQGTAQGDSQFANDRYKDWSVLLKASLPLYEGGATRARVAQAKAQAAVAQAQAEDAHNAVRETITQAWALLQADDELTRAYQSDLEASSLALEDVHKELDAGTRTTKDLLDAERDRLSAQVNLTGSLHDRAVVAFQLLEACGKLKLEDVK